MLRADWTAGLCVVNEFAWKCPLDEDSRDAVDMVVVVDFEDLLVAASIRTTNATSVVREVIMLMTAAKEEVVVDGEGVHEIAHIPGAEEVTLGQDLVAVKTKSVRPVGAVAGADILVQCHHLGTELSN